MGAPGARAAAPGRVPARRRGDGRRSCPIGTWTIEQACRQMAAWHDGAGADAQAEPQPLGPPVRRADPARAGEADHRRDRPRAGLGVARDHRGHAARTTATRATQTLRQLHEIGVRLVIDDFGTGASSLVSLKQFPIDAIKIASTFVADLGRDRDSDAICSAIVDLAHSLGLVRDRRGRRDARAVRGVAGARLRARPGSSLRSGAAGRGVRRARRRPPWASSDAA